jgi:hypothetical protein
VLKHLHAFRDVDEGHVDGSLAVLLVLVGILLRNLKAEKYVTLLTATPNILVKHSTHV